MFRLKESVRDSLQRGESLLTVGYSNSAFFGRSSDNGLAIRPALIMKTFRSANQNVSTLCIIPTIDIKWRKIQDSNEEVVPVICMLEGKQCACTQGSAISVLGSAFAGDVRNINRL